MATDILKKSIQDLAKDEQLSLLYKNQILLKDIADKYAQEPEVARKAVKLNPKNYEYCPSSVQNEVEIASIALNVDGMYIKHLTKENRSRYDLCSIAVANNPEALKYVNISCLDNKLILLALDKSDKIYDCIPYYIRIEKEIYETILKKYPNRYDDVANDLIDIIEYDIKNQKIYKQAYKKATSSNSNKAKRESFFDNKYKLIKINGKLFIKIKNKKTGVESIRKFKND